MRKILLLVLCLSMAASQLWAQNRTITGRVVDDKGAPLAGVTVSVVNSNVRAMTNPTGDFSISVPSTARQLEFTYVGFTTFRANIGSSSTVNVTLNPSTSDLEGVVVTGYGRTKRSTYSGAAAKIDKKAIELTPMASFDQILQGRSPGLLVTSGSGAPGAAARVQIRGALSVSSGATPLYVVDGVPVEASVFQSLNPNDFESVDVLKDAVASSLYGSRGAAGVIVVTTKRGRAGKTVLSYRGQTGMTQTGTQQFEMMNSEELLRWQEMLGVAAGAVANGLPGWDNSKKNPSYATATPAQQAQRDRNLDSLRSINTDWTDIFFRTGTFSQHDLNLSGGTERTKFFGSVGMYNEEGIAMRSDLKRYTFRLNVDHTTDKLNMGLSTSVGYSKRNFIESENSVTLANPFAAAYLALPYHSAYKPDGTPLVGGGRVGGNAISRILDRDVNNNQLKANLALTLNYNITNNIYVGGTGGVDFRETNNVTITKPGTFTAFVSAFPVGPSVPGDTTTARGAYNEGMNRHFQHSSRVFAGFRKVFADKHSVDISVNNEYIERRRKNFAFTGYGLNDKLPAGPAAITPGTVSNQLIPAVGGGNDLLKLHSIFAIGKYSFLEKYTLDLSLRSDRHSLLPIKNREQKFYMIGANWNILKEKFSANWRNVNTLRFRVSYGNSANAENFPFNAGDYYATFTAGSYAGLPTLVPNYFGNPDLDWEYTNQLNIGVDFGFFRDRISGTLDLYNKTTDGLLLSQQLPAELGSPTASLLVNAGEVRNRGIELTLNGDIIRGRNLTWSVGGNLAYNQNEITSLGQVNEFEQGTSIVRVGLPIGSHYMVRWGGVDAATGQDLYYTKDGKLTNVYSAANSVADFGTFNAPFIGGFNTTVRFKGFELAAFFTFQSGFSRFNNQDFFQLNHAFALQGFNLRKEMLNMWTKPGDVTDIQSPLTQRQFSSKDIQDASYLRFRNLTASYTIPRSILGKQKIVSNVRIFGQAQNLYTWTKWTGFDPEDNNNIAQYEYPVPRIYTVGIDVSF